ncbi:MAG: glycosyltransferase family 2 protein [Gemmatimonadota bacterium]
MSSVSTVDLAIVLPVYNEEASIERVVREWWPEVERYVPAFEFIVIDDGSMDETPLVISRLRAELGERLTCVRQENHGHGSACMAGYRQAVEGEALYILQIDSDGQCDPRFFRMLWGLRDRSPLVYGKRVRRDDGTFRMLASSVLRTGVFLATGVWCADPNVPFRLMRTGVVASYISRVPRDFVLANVALTVLLEWDRVPATIVPIHFRQRFGGRPSVRPLTMGARGIQLVRQLTAMGRGESPTRSNR